MASGPIKRENAAYGAGEVTSLSSCCWGDRAQATAQIHVIKVCRMLVSEACVEVLAGVEVIRRDAVRNAVFFIVRFRDWLISVEVGMNDARVHSSYKMPSHIRG